MITTAGKGQKMSTPGLTSTLVDGHAAMMNAGADSIEDDWTATPQIHECGVCKGTKIDPNDLTACIACEGSGIDYELHYGVEDKKPFAYVVQHGLATLAAYCKAMREAEVESVRVKSPMVNAFALPQYVRIELMAEGWPVDEMRNEGQLRELANVVAKRWPEFMTTNLLSF